ncbi:hypothetical protein [Rhabdochlamydiaceae symbiont of Dictyostelium giganteum]|uniref:hypothetical protein n=1 Tax=Rhabdochlamydiaceae symbiont of Dictyostelium giganteum TaxID=3342349 RepID=UPI00384C2582
MTITPYSLMKAESASLHQENLSSVLEEEKSSKRLQVETSKTEQIANVVLEINHNKDVSAGVNLANAHQINKPLSDQYRAKKESLLQEIHCNSKDEKAYCNLADLLKEGEIIQFLNGESYTQKELYLKATQLNPQYEKSYNGLANCLKGDETVQFFNGESYAKKELYLKAIKLNPQEGAFYCNLADCLKDDEMVQLLSGETYTKKGLYLKASELDPQGGTSNLSLAILLEDNETIHLLNEKLYTKKDLYYKAIDLDPNLLNFDRTRQYLQKFYSQEMEKNPKNIENHFGLIEIIQHSFIPLEKREIIECEFLFKEALDIDPTQAFSARFAHHFLSIANYLHEKTKSLVNNDISLRTQLLKEGASLTLKNGKMLSVKALYQHALPMLSLSDLEYRGDTGVGDYLSYRKYTVLQDGTKFTKLMAYQYAYKKYQSPHILMKIGDALHPEQRVLLNEKFYDKRTCYEEASLDEKYDKLLLRRVESLYPHESLRRKNLVRQALKHAYRFSRNRLALYTTLARILAQYKLKGLVSNYLFMFKEDLQEDYLTQNETSHLPIAARIPNQDSLMMDDDLYLIKREEFLLKLLTHVPSCEEAYVALAKNFQAPLIIHEKNYASKESLYLQAIDINPEYSLPYFLLGKELFHQKVASIQLLNGITLSCKQLLMRAIQLGTYEPEAYHLAALLMQDKDGILLFDEKTILSKGDLFIRAFELDSERVIDLKNFISYVKRVVVK